MNKTLENKFSEFIELVEKWILNKQTGRLKLEVNLRHGGIADCHVYTKNRLKEG